MMGEEEEEDADERDDVDDEEGDERVDEDYGDDEEDDDVGLHATWWADYHNNKAAKIWNCILVEYIS